MQSDDHDHVLSFGKLAMVLLALFILTAITIGVSRYDLGALNIWVALLIASFKGSLVLLFFMHLKYESRFLQGTFILTLITLAILIGFMFWDIAYR